MILVHTHASDQTEPRALVRSCSVCAREAQSWRITTIDEIKDAVLTEFCHRIATEGGYAFRDDGDAREQLVRRDSYKTASAGTQAPRRSSPIILALSDDYGEIAQSQCFALAPEAMRSSV
jgi:hypothetical protein